MGQTTRREFLKDAAILGAGINSGSFSGETLLTSAIPSQQMGSSASAAKYVTLSCLGENPPAAPTGVSWGVSWPQGAVSRDSHFSLRAQQQQLPLQNWPLVFWPDGSLKWSGFATVVPSDLKGPILLTADAAPSAAPQGALRVTHDSGQITVDTGTIKRPLRRSLTPA